MRVGRMRGLLLVVALSVAGCSNYAGVMFRENCLRPTPRMEADGDPQPQVWPDDRLTVSWIGHATVLLNFYGTVILTDPMFSERLGPPEWFGQNAGIRRISDLPCTFEDLPPVDVVLLSHAHHDHWDMPTLRKFDRRTAVVFPTGNGDLVPAETFGLASELDWGQEVAIGDVKITAFQVSHWGHRWGAADHPRGFNGYLIRGHGHMVVFIGDTAYGDVTMAETTGKRPRFELTPANWKTRIGVMCPDLCILPIGEYIFRGNHMSPEEAWSVFETVQGRYFLATHWRTFILSPRDRLPTHEPMERLQRVAGDDVDRIVCAGVGTVFSLPEPTDATAASVR